MQTHLHILSNKILTINIDVGAKINDIFTFEGTETQWIEVNYFV